MYTKDDQNLKAESKFKIPFFKKRKWSILTGKKVWNVLNLMFCFIDKIFYIDINQYLNVWKLISQEYFKNSKMKKSNLT